MIDNLLVEALKTLNIPVSRLKYAGNASTYIIFQKYLEQVEEYSNDDEEIKGHYYLVTIYTKENYLALSVRLKELIKEAGFKITYETEDYNNKSEYYEKIFRFYYFE